MIPCLYEPTETAFAHNGIGKLADCLSCIVTEKRNGSYELKMEYPASGIHADSMKEGCIILARPAEQKQSQPFRIYKISTPLNGKLEVAARHISYALNHITVAPFSASGIGASLVGLKANATTTNQFEFWTDIVSTAGFGLAVPASLRNCLGGMEGSILDVFGGEFEWDRFLVRVHQSRGRDNGVHIRYGKNLVDFKMERNIENVITGVHPYWTNSETGEVLQLPEKIVTVEKKYTAYDKVIPLDCTSAFEEMPSIEQLRSYANNYLKNTSQLHPDIDISIDFLQLWQTPGYEDVAAAERVSLCDTVWVYISKLGIEVSSKVTEVEYDTLLERYKSITLSNSTVSSRNSSLTASLGSIQSSASSAYLAAIRAETAVTDVTVVAQNQSVFNILAAALFGLHYSSGMDEKGNTVRYAHNAWMLADSTFAWKNSEDGYFISTDGGKHWSYGWMDDGSAVETAFRVMERAALDARYVLQEGLTDTLDERYVQSEGLTDELDRRYVQSSGLTDTLDKRYIQSYGFQEKLDSRYVQQEGLTDTLDERYIQSEGFMETLDGRYAKAEDIPQIPAPQIGFEFPEEPVVNTLVIDTAMNPPRLKMWNGETWVIVGYELPEEPEPPTEPEPTEPAPVDPNPTEPVEPVEPEPTEPETPEPVEPVAPEEGGVTDGGNNESGGQTE